MRLSLWFFLCAHFCPKSEWHVRLCVFINEWDLLKKSNPYLPCFMMAGIKPICGKCPVNLSEIFGVVTLVGEGPAIPIKRWPKGWPDN